MAFERLRRLFEMLAKLRELFPTIGIEDFLAIIQALAKLLPLPDLADEAGCRQWCRLACGVADQIAEITPTEIDDNLVAVARKAIDDDTLWAMVWSLFEWVAKEGDDATTEVKATELGERLGIDPFSIIAIIQAVIQFISWWKNRDAKA